MRELVRYILSLFGTQTEHEIPCSGDIQETTPYEEIEEIDMSLLRIIRKYKLGGTTGDIVFPCGTVLKSLELPWLNNQPKIEGVQDGSCIPEGLYPVRIRTSPLITRLTKGKYTQGYEICDVPKRTFIMFHQGNFIKDSDGCVLTGMTAGTHEGLPAVWSSASAFDIFMDLMAKHKINQVSIERAAE
jgi:hypothetical protein